MKIAGRSIKRSEVLGLALLYLGLALVAFLTLYPFYYCLVQSLNNGYDSRIGGVYWWPRDFTLENFEAVFQNEHIVTAFGVTIARTLLGTVLSVVFTALFAYGISKNIMGRKFYSTMGLITMYFSGGLIPFYFLIKDLGLLDTFWVYIIPSLFSYYNALLFMANFRAIPSSIEEAALIDGANEFKTFFVIILPLSTPILATIALFNGVYHWNDWFTTAIYTTDPGLYTLPAILKDIINYASSMEELRSRMAITEGKVTIEALRYATMMVAVIPITLAYPFLQKYFVKGMMVGAVKA